MVVYRTFDQNIMQDYGYIYIYGFEENLNVPISKDIFIRKFGKNNHMNEVAWVFFIEVRVSWDMYIYFCFIYGFGYINTQIDRCNMSKHEKDKWIEEKKDLTQF